MPKKINLIGKRFGRLVVLRESGRSKSGDKLYLCHCDCGNEITVNGRYLRNGDTRSCGCLKLERDILQAEKLAGQRFGRLVVVKRAENRNHGKATAWLCKCDCGNTCIVMSDKLKSGHTRSCGCIRDGTKAKDYFDGTYDTLREAIDAHARAVKKYHLPVIEEFEEEKGESKDAKNEKNH